MGAISGPHCTGQPQPSEVEWERGQLTSSGSTPMILHRQWCAFKLWEMANECATSGVTLRKKKLALVAAQWDSNNQLVDTAGFLATAIPNLRLPTVDVDVGMPLPTRLGRHTK